jgi:hypothetical protein
MIGSVIKITSEMDLLNSFVVLDETDQQWKIDLSGQVRGKRGSFKKPQELLNAVCEISRSDPDDSRSKLISYIRTAGITTQGPPGERGPAGPTGAPGGPPGPPGRDGGKGEHGEKGNTGDRGERGDKGEPGPQGLPGKDGRDGRDGSVGKEGPQGKPGRDGKDGINGKDGQKGDKGDKGDQGERGSQGHAGRDGINGWIKAIPADEFKPWKSHESGTIPARSGGDSRFASLSVLRFDDTVRMSAGGNITFPSASKKVKLRIRAKHTQMPDEEKARYAVLKMTFRPFTDNGLGNWITVSLGRFQFNYTLKGEEKYLMFERTIALNDDTGIKAGVDYQFLVMRDPQSEEDDLIGDFTLQSIAMEVE